ncbi:hypothetical protein HAZT_HAZT000008 [Hyalella azteca]|nr:hypothetical protein HAZT_HAZT000008 [Hyalella azteca]
MIQSLSSRVHGQHLVQDVVMPAIISHFQDPQPNKALVISLQGETGTGKNFVSQLVAEAVFKKGLTSKYIRKFIASVDFKLMNETDIYKVELADKIRESVMACERSMFIFDEVHMMAPELLNALKPFVDSHTEIHGVDYRKATFLFLSNAGTTAIRKFVLDWLTAGKQRADITLEDMEGRVAAGAFEEKG